MLFLCACVEPVDPQDSAGPEPDSGRDSDSTTSDSADSGDSAPDSATDSGDTGDTGDSADSADSGDSGDSGAPDSGDSATSVILPDVVGRVYPLSISTGVVEAPIGGDTLFTLFSLSAYLQPTAASGTGLSATLWLSDGSGSCETENDFPEADFSAAPAFELGPVDAGVPDMADMFLATVVWGEFAPDGGSIQDSAMAFNWDMDILGADANLGGGEEICDVLGAMGISCNPCDDEREVCLYFRITGMEGAEVRYSPTPC